MIDIHVLVDSPIALALFSVTTFLSRLLPHSMIFLVFKAFSHQIDSEKMSRNAINHPYTYTKHTTELKTLIRKRRDEWTERVQLFVCYCSWKQSSFGCQFFSSAIRLIRKIFPSFHSKLLKKKKERRAPKRSKRRYVRVSNKARFILL